MGHFVFLVFWIKRSEAEIIQITLAEGVTSVLVVPGHITWVTEDKIPGMTVSIFSGNTQGYTAMPIAVRNCHNISVFIVYLYKLNTKNNSNRFGFY
jgi:hypothetical protein